MKKRKPKTKRASKKYPALDPGVNLLSRYDELTDFDYLQSLPEDCKDFMNRFLEEWVGANFNHKGEILNKGKEGRKLCYDRNNARNRDIYSRKKTQGKLIVFSELNGNEDHYDFEDKAISNVDSEKQQQGKRKPQ